MPGHSASEVKGVKEKDSCLWRFKHSCSSRSCMLGVHSACSACSLQKGLEALFLQLPQAWHATTNGGLLWCVFASFLAPLSAAR